MVFTAVLRSELRGSAAAFSVNSSFLRRESIEPSLFSVDSNPVISEPIIDDRATVENLTDIQQQHNENQWHLYLFSAIFAARSM